MLTTPPAATTLAPTAITTMGATLNGSVNPDGSSTTVSFQYSTDPGLPANVVTFLAGSPGSADGTGSAAGFSHPAGVAVDAAGNVYVADQGNDTIRKITPGGVVSTLAGAAGEEGSADGTGSAARFSLPYGVAVDAAGNVYVADAANDEIRKITPDGAVTRLAGAEFNQGSADGTGAAAQFLAPEGVAVDSAGNVYVADTYNDTIRMVTPGGVVTTLAGSPGHAGSSDGTGSAARFDMPTALAVDSVGDIYVADTLNETIRKIAPGGVVTTLAGTAGDQGETDGIGAAARFSSPNGVAVDPAGNLEVADTGGGAIRTVTPAGVVTTLRTSGAFDSPFGVAVDAAGTLFVSDDNDDVVQTLSVASVPVQTALSGTSATTVSASLTGLAPSTTYYERVVASSAGGTTQGGIVSFTTATPPPPVAPTVATQAATGITGTAATLNASVNPDGSSTAASFQYSTDPSLPADVVTTLAGSPGRPESFDGTGSAARFFHPSDVATDSAGNIYVTDTTNDTIRKITPAGSVTTLAGSHQQVGSTDGTGSAARFNQPYGLAVDSAGNVYVADSGNNTIRKVTPAGVVTTLASTAGQSGSTDATGAAARFNEPDGVAVDSAGNVYVADAGNDTIREITPAGVVTTLAGTTGQTGSTDGTGAAARFNDPVDVAVDAAGNLYVADFGGNTIRKITAGGVVTTLAGSPGQAGSNDGTGAAALFNGPGSVAVDSAGNVYVADQNNDTIREITPAGVVTTLAGSVGLAGDFDGIGTAAEFNVPYGVAVDRLGDVYVAAYNSDTIRRLSIPTINAQSGLTGSSAVAVSAALTGLLPGTTYYDRAVAVNAGGLAAGSIVTFTTPALAPVATTLPATQASGTVATLAADVNPRGAATTVSFVYSTDPTLATGRTTTATQAIGSGTSPVVVTAALTGLQPDTTYYEEVVATNSAGTTTGAIGSFATSPPAAATQPASNVTGTGATLNATVNPNGSSTATFFQYSADPSLPPNVVTTLAGVANSIGTTDGTGHGSLLDEPNGVAVDSAGNVYVADTNNDTIRKITPAGVVTTLAGMAGQRGSADGTGSAARFAFPQAVAVDAAGNVYVADTFNDTIRKITPAGVVTTLAGTVEQAGSTDGTGSAALFDGPSSVAVDAAGNVYVADAFNDTIRKITPAGVVTTLAGTSHQQGSADGTGSAAQFDDPTGVAVDSAGNIYVADTDNDTVRKITPAGVVTTLAGMAGQTGSGDGSGTAALFNEPAAVAVDAAGNVYLADTGNDTIRKITPAGVVTTLAGMVGQRGTADGTGSVALFNQPTGVAVDAAGHVYVADTGNDTIRKLDGVGVVATFAGTPGEAGSADGAGPAALFNDPGSVAVDSAGDLYVADTDNETIRKITPAGVVSTFAGVPGVAGATDGIAGAALFDNPAGLAVDAAGNVYVADTDNDTIRKINAAGVVTTLAGSAGQRGTADGTGSVALFDQPTGVAVDAAGNVYVADTDNETIRKITPAGVVTTLAGNPGFSGSADGTGAAAEFNGPQAVAVDAVGNVYVADLFNDEIRKVTPAGVVTTLAGTAGTQGSADGTGSAALFDDPEAVAVDAAGNVYVADTFNDTIRRITPAGIVTTLAGMVGQDDTVDGTGSAARFDEPEGLAVDAAGNLYVADTFGDTIRKSSIATVSAQSGLTGTSPVAVTATLTGLTAGTSYYDRVVAASTGGIALGAILGIGPNAVDANPPAATTQAATGLTSTTATLQGSVNPAGSTASAMFIYGTDPNLVTGTTATLAQSLGSGTSPETLTVPLTGLEPGTTYYDEVVATGAGGTATGTILSFATPVQSNTPPAASTQPATAVTSTGATLNASVNPEGSATSVMFVYGTNASLATGTTTTTAQSIGGGTSAVAVTAPLTGLTPGTTYYFQAVATSAAGTPAGTILSFTTSTQAVSAPTATTQTATGVTNTAATLNASVNPEGSATTVTFVYGTNASLATGTTTTTAAQSIGGGTSAVAVTAPLTGLTPGTTYYFQAVATSAAGTPAGMILSFTTSTQAVSAPTATTQTATGVTNTAATLNASVNPEGSATTVTFVYGTNATLATGTTTTTATQSIGGGTSAVAVTAPLTGLTPGTTYYLRVLASSAGGTPTGTILSFMTTTQAVSAPTATTQAATGVTSTAAALNASVNPQGSATSVTFVYGTDASLTTGTTTAAQSIGGGTGAGAVTAPLTGLTPGTTYYFQAVATSAGGTTDGSILSFTTAAQAMATIQFAAGPFTANVSDGTAQVTLTRAGDLSGTVTVVVSSPGGPGVAAFQQTVTFGPNAPNAAVSVAIQNDGKPTEPDVSIPLSLSSPGPGAALGATTTASLVVHDNNSPPAPVTATLTLVPVKVTTVKGRKAKTKTEMGLQLKLSGALSGAGNAAAYAVSTGKTKKGVTTFSKPKPPAMAVYDPSALTVTLTPAVKLNLSQPEQLRVTATLLTDSFGRALDGNHDGQPGGDFVATFSNKGIMAARVQSASRIGHPSAAAVDALFAEGSIPSVRAAARRP